MRYKKNWKFFWDTFLRGFSYNYRLTHNLCYPRDITIEATNICNGSCIMCPHGYDLIKNKGKMDFKLFKKIINQIQNWEVRISLNGYGEPLLHPKIIDMIKFAQEKCLNKIEFATNAFFLNEEIAQKLIELNLYMIVISLNAATANTYKKIENRDDYNYILKNIYKFLELKKKYYAGKYKDNQELIRLNPQVEISFVKMKENTKEENLFIKMWEDKGVYLRIQNINSFSQQLSNIEDLFLKNKYLPELPCERLWTRMEIWWDGRVVICDNDFKGKVVLGNVNKQSLGEIWNGKIIRGIRKKHIEGIFDNSLCKNCEYAVGREINIFYPLKVFKLPHIIKKINNPDKKIYV